MFIYADESGNSGRNIFDANEWYRLGAIFSLHDVEPQIEAVLRPLLTPSEEPRRVEPLFERARDGAIDARPWCMGFYAAMKLRLFSWSKLLQTGSVDHGLLLPILFHCVDDAGQPMIGPLRAGAQTPAFAREAWREIAPAIIAMREYWQPFRFNKSA